MSDRKEFVYGMTCWKVVREIDGFPVVSSYCDCPWCKSTIMTLRGAPIETENIVNVGSFECPECERFGYWARAVKSSSVGVIGREDVFAPCEALLLDCSDRN